MNDQATVDGPPPRLTVDRKILLHLMEHQHREMDFEVPWDLVQDGIASAVQVRRDNIPRTIKRLREEDLIYESLKRVKGLPRKRKAYFLSEKGTTVAREIMYGVGGYLVYLQMRDGSVKNIPLGEVASYLSLKMPILDMFGMVSEEGNIREEHIRSLSSGESKTPVRSRLDGFASFLKDVPMPKRFLGRENELLRIREWIEEEHSSLLALTGIAGIGKTTLASKAAQEAEGRMHIYWYRFHRWDSLRNVLFSLSRFFEDMGRGGLKTYLDSSPDLDLKDFNPIFESSIREGPILMVFDDFQRAADEVVEFFGILKEMLPSTRRIKVMVVGRQVFPFFDRSDVLVKRRVTELILEGLDRESCRGLLRIKDIDDYILENIYRATKGHPLFLQLVLSAKDMENQKDIKRYIYEEIFKKLEERESLLLQVASTFRYPVPSSGLFMEEGLDFTTLDRLVEKNLIQETSYDEYEAHDLIKEFFYNRLTPCQRKDYHRRASDFYMEDGTDRATVEAMYHLASAGDHLKAWRLASSYGERIISRGYVEQFSSVLDLLERQGEGTSSEFGAVSYLLKGKVHMIMGRWDKALSVLKRASAVAEVEDQTLVSARANLLIGEIETRRGKRDPALKRLKKALKVAQKLDNRELAANAMQTIGELYSAKGDFALAREHFKRSLELAVEMENHSLEAASHTGLGIVYSNQDRSRKATEQFRKAIQALEMGENVIEMARVKIALGSLFTSTGELEDAITQFEDAIELCSGSGDIRQQGYALSGAARVYLIQDDTSLAKEYLDEGLGIFTNLGEKFKIATIHLDYGRMKLIEKDLPGARMHFDNAVKLITELGSPYYLKRIKGEIGDLLRSKGKTKEALRYKE